ERRLGQVDRLYRLVAVRQETALVATGDVGEAGQQADDQERAHQPTADEPPRPSDDEPAPSVQHPTPPSEMRCGPRSPAVLTPDRHRADAAAVRGRVRGVSEA